MIITLSSVRRYVAETLQLKELHPDRYQERVEGYKAALCYDIEHADIFFNSPEHFKTEWMKRFLKIDKVLEALNPGIDVDGVLQSIELENCSAVSLYFKAREKRIRSGIPPNDNEVDDWLFLPVVPYADLVLVDNNFREFILQADRSLQSKVVSNAAETVVSPLPAPLK